MFWIFSRATAIVFPFELFAILNS